MRNFAIVLLFVISLFVHPAYLKSEQNGIIGCFYFHTPEEHNIVGLGDERKMVIDEMMNSFKISLKFLNHKLISYENLSKNNLQHHLFRFRRQIVRVLWSKEGNTEEVEIPGNYRVYNYQGKEIKESRLVPSSSPIFMVKTMD